MFCSWASGSNTARRQVHGQFRLWADCPETLDSIVRDQQRAEHLIMSIDCHFLVHIATYTVAVMIVVNLT